MKTQPPEDPKQSRHQKPAPGSDLRKVVPIVCSLASGCTGVPVKPDAYTCPEGSQRAMRELHWDLFQRFSIVLDDRHDEDADIWLRPGDTVVGVVTGVYGGSPQEKLAPPGTQFLGGKVYVWPEKTASGKPGRVVVKYERVKLPRQDEVPVCFVVDVSADELKDGAARTANGTNGIPVDYWRP